MKYEKAIKRRLRLIESAMKALRTLNKLPREHIDKADLHELDRTWKELVWSETTLQSVTGKSSWPEHMSVAAVRRFAKEVASRSHETPGKTGGGWCG